MADILFTPVSVVKHGLSQSKEFQVWASAKTRCHNPKFHNFQHWGGRGIQMCERWRHSFKAFYADMGPCPDGCSLDRIDNDRGYEPSNCRWATPIEQHNNTRVNRWLTANGETHTVTEWARLNGLRAGTVFARLRMGWSAERAVNEQPSPYRHETNGIPRSIVKARIHKGWTRERAETTPVTRHRRAS